MPGEITRSISRSQTNGKFGLHIIHYLWHSQGHRIKTTLHSILQMAITDSDYGRYEHFSRVEP